MITDQLLIIFIKNPVKGKVKTRLAKTMGDDKAFEIYKKMLVHTFSITKKIGCDKIVYYSDCIEPGDVWHQAGYSHQAGGSAIFHEGVLRDAGAAPCISVERSISACECIRRDGFGHRLSVHDHRVLRQA